MLSKWSNNKITMLILGFSGLLVMVGLITMVIGKRMEGAKISANQVVVAATIAPLADIVAHVGGEHVSVTSLLPSGASPHSYELTPSQVTQLSKAQMLFVIGHEFDNWATKAVSPDTNIITTDRDIVLLDSDHKHDHGDHDHDDEADQAEVVDPHYWLSIPNGILMAQTVRDALIQEFPEYEVDFMAAYEVYVAELVRLDLEIRQQLSGVETRQLAVFHPAWSYFAKDYGFEVVATFQETAGVEPTLDQLRTFMNEVADHQLGVVFVEPQLSSDSLASTAREIGVRLVEIDPEGGSKGREKYSDLMLFNAQQIVTAYK